MPLRCRPVLLTLLPALLLSLAGGADSQQPAPSPDFDGSGVVDFDDFFLFAAAFGSRRGEAGYETRFDLSGNGLVDFDDFFLFAADFGRRAGQTGGGTKELRVFIADLLGGRVEVVGAKDNLRILSLPAELPRGLAFSPDGRTVYVACVDSFHAIRQDGSRDFSVELPTGFKAAIAPDGLKAYVTQEAGPGQPVGGVGVVDLRTKRYIRTIPLPGRPSGLALTPDGRKAYVANRTRRLMILDLAREVVSDSVAIPGGVPTRVTLSADGGTAYLNSNATDTIHVLDTGTDRVVRTYATKPSEPHIGSQIVDLVPSPDGKRLYALGVRVFLAVVAGSSDLVPTTLGELLLLDTATGKADRIPLGESVGALGVAPDQTTAYVALQRVVGEDPEVTILDLAAKKAIGSLPLALLLPVEIRFREVSR